MVQRRSALSGDKDRNGVLDLEFWKESGGVERWRDLHAAAERPSESHLLRRCTYAGRPFGEEAFVERIETTFQRKWRRWSFEKTLGGRSLAAS